MLLKEQKHIKNNYINKKVLYMIVYGDSKKINRVCNKIKRKWITKFAWTYFFVLSAFIVISLGTLIFNIETIQKHKYIFIFSEMSTFVFLAVDFGLRWYTSDIDMKKRRLSYLLFLIKPFSILMLFQMLPVIYVYNIVAVDNNSHPIWVVIRVFKLTRIIRIIMSGTLFPSMMIFRIILKKNRAWLLIVFSLIILIILSFASGVYTAEVSYYNKYHIAYTSASITSYWKSIYYCAIAITTIGFGDITVVSNLGRVLTICMSFLGLIILTFPAGILAASFIVELKIQKEELREWHTSAKYKEHYQPSKKWYENFIRRTLDKEKLVDKLKKEKSTNNNKINKK